MRHKESFETSTACCCGLVAALLAAGCGQNIVVETGLTGVELTVVAGLELDQLSIGGEVDGQEISGPEGTLVPARPRPLDPEGESAVLVVDDGLAGAEIVITVDGLVEGETRASGTTRVMLVEQQLVAATILLHCAGAGCGECSRESCPSGCCDDDVCQLGTTDEACGDDGERCRRCNDHEDERCVDQRCEDD